MIKYIKSIWITVQLWYYTIVDFIDDELERDRGNLEVTSIERSKENSKLARGVKRMNNFLRSLSPEELRARDKIIRNPVLVTEDDLVNKVVKSAPRYVIEGELKEVRKAITACLRASGENPSDPKHLEDMKALKAKQKLLKAHREFVVKVGSWIGYQGWSYTTVDCVSFNKTCFIRSRSILGTLTVL